MLLALVVACTGPELPETEWFQVPPAPVRDLRIEGVTEADLVGRWTLVVVGWMSCPDVCPAALRGLASVAAEDDVQVWFVSIDPDRDRDRLQDVAWYHDDLRGLTGTRDALDGLVQTLGLSYAPDGDAWEHSTSAALVDPEANLVGYVLQPSDPLSLRRALDRARASYEPHADLWTADGPPGAEMWAVYGELKAGVQGVRAPGYGQAQLHQTVVRDGRARMEPRSSLPAGSRLEPGGTHLMVGGGSPPADRLLLDLELSDGRALVLAPVR